MEKRTSYDGVEFVVRMSIEQAELITAWAKLKPRTLVTLEDLKMSSSITKDELNDYVTEIKFYISEALLVKETETLAESSLSVSEQRKTPRKKELAYSRHIIKIKINRKYNNLLKKLFPSSPSVKQENDETIPSNDVKEDEETVPSNNVKEDEETVPSSEDETATDDAHDDVESLTNISMLSIN